MTDRGAMSQRVVGHVRWRLARIQRSLADAAQVRQWLSYLLRETRSGTTIGRYNLRDGEATVLLRHHTDDTGVFAEIFRAEFYTLPDQLSADLRSLGEQATIVDLGANIGLFGAWVLTQFPAAHVIAFEPDRTSLSRLREFMALNGPARAWTVIAACASNQDGIVAFTATGTSTSQMTQPGSAEVSTEVPAVDVFDYLEAADILKMDIEGGEWNILLDPRWRRVAPRAVVMEYHPQGCPGPDARKLATDLLRAANYSVESVMHDAAGHGMLRAVRD